MAEIYCSPAFNQWVAGSSPARLIAKHKWINYLRAVSDDCPIYFARILLQNRLHKYGICSVLCTTHEVVTRNRFSYLQFMGLYSKSPKLAFNQLGVGSSHTQFIRGIDFFRARLVGNPASLRRGRSLGLCALCCGGISLQIVFLCIRKIRQRQKN